MKLSEIKPLTEISDEEKNDEKLRKDVALLTRVVSGWSTEILKGKLADYPNKNDPRARVIFNELKKRGNE